MTRGRFTTLRAGRYQWELPQLGTTFEADRLHWDRYQLEGELIVRCELAGAHTEHTEQGALSWSTFNFTSITTRHTLAKRLEAQSAAPELAWQDYVESFCQQVLHAERAGAPAVRLVDVPDPPPDDAFVVERLRIPKTVPSMLFGDGDSCKSTLALYIAGRLAQDGTRCGFFDWELNQGQQKNRYRQMFGQQMPDGLIYVECVRPIVHEADRLARIVTDLRLDFAVFDSVVPACGVRPEDAEMASAYFRSVRTIGGPSFTSLHIAHINKSENGDSKPFGSVFWSNLVRQSWFVKASDPQPGEATTVALYPRKHNLGPRGGAVGFAVSFVDNAIAIWSTDVTDVPELAARAPLWQRLVGALHGGSKTIKQLADELDAKPNSIEQAIARGRNTFTKVLGSDGIHRVGLLDRRSIH